MEVSLLNSVQDANMYQAILDEVTAMITVIDMDTYEILYANKAAIEITQKPSGKYVGSYCYESIANSTTPCPYCMMNRAVTDTYVSKEIDYGAHMYEQLFKVINWNGKKALLVYGEDITKQKQSLYFAETEKNLLNNILNNIPTGIFVIKMEKEGFFIFEANPAICSMLGIEHEKVIGTESHNLLSLVHPFDREEVQKMLERLCFPDVEISKQYRSLNRRTNEYIWLSLDGHSSMQADGTVYAYLSFHDITEQKKVLTLEAELATSKQAAETKAEFYSQMSHDMRTPMNGILGITELAKQETDIHQLHLDIEKIEESGKYMLSLINDTLDLQRMETGRMKLEKQVVYAADLVDNIISMVKPAADSKNIDLSVVNINVDLDCYLRVDPIRLKQIVVNLLSNAVKFTPENGRVELALEKTNMTGHVAHAFIRVTDTGIGMSQKFMKKGIFKPFSQEQNEMTMMYPGSGLGLSIVKSLVEIMGGSITVESEEGTGSVFTIYINLEVVSKREYQQLNTKESSEKEQTRLGLKGKRILICEDHPLNAEIAKRLLQNMECEVEWAKNGSVGANMFANSDKGYYDAVLMDIRMPVMDGIVATKTIRESNHPDAKSVPIIAMSANAYAEDVDKSKEAGMDAHLAKPVDAQRLYITLAEFIQKRNILY